MDVATLVVLVAALGIGMASALVPVVNAEVYLAATAAASTGTIALVAAVSLAVGQTGGKVVLFAAARRGRRWAVTRESGEPSRWTLALRRWTASSPGTVIVRRTAPALARLREWGVRGMVVLDRPWPATGVLLASASFGLPPLAATSVAAGVRTTSPVLFALCTLVGRIARFGVIAWSGAAIG